jgi:predicted esterase YcpF (UPF0227 family)
MLAPALLARCADGVYDMVRSAAAFRGAVRVIEGATDHGANRLAALLTQVGPLDQARNNDLALDFSA